MPMLVRQEAPEMPMPVRLLWSGEEPPQGLSTPGPAALCVQALAEQWEPALLGQWKPPPLAGWGLALLVEASD